VLEEQERWVVPTEAPVGVVPRGRLTLTLPAIAAARRVFFVITGAAKREAFGRVRRRIEPLPPAAFVRARETLLWIVDAAAAGDSA
jgi:6-phosphogluconolactonase